MFDTSIPLVIRRALAGAAPFRRKFTRGSRRLTAPRRVMAATAVALCLSVAPRHAAVGRISPAAKLDATYTATLLGLPIGHINWTIEIGEDHFAASASGETVGLLRIFSPGQGVATADGKLSEQRPVAANFTVTLSHGNASDETRVLFNAGKAKEFLTPPPPPDPRRVPVTDAYRTGVIDPMTALLIHVPGSGDTVTPAACERKIPVFDGHMRYDLQLSYKRLEQVRTETGYRGRAVVCAISFTPLAGFDPTRSAIRYLEADKGMEIWLAPLAGTRLLVPFRISVPTPIGLGVLQATRFIWTEQHGQSGTLSAG